MIHELYDWMYLRTLAFELPNWLTYSFMQLAPADLGNEVAKWHHHPSEGWSASV